MQSAVRTRVLIFSFLFSPLPSPLLFSSSFLLFPLPSSLLIREGTRVLIFLVLMWVVVLALWGRGLLVGILWSWGALCFGGLAVSFGFSCGLGFVVAMAWCVVLVLGVVFWWWRRARV